MTRTPYGTVVTAAEAAGILRALFRPLASGQLHTPGRWFNRWWPL
jgi:hypothetical protein